MNYITNFFRVGCVALLAMLILAPGAFAQQDPPTEPNPPTDLEAVATDAAAGSIILTWSPVTGDDNGGFDVPLTAAGYQIEVSADYDAADPTAATWATVPSGEIAVTPAAPEADPAVPKFTAVHTLPTTDAGGEAIPTHNLTRHYRVSAINVIGTGDPSTVAMATTHNVPDPPTDLAAASSITITWSPIEAANNGGLPVALADGYVLEVTATPTVDDSWEASGSVTSGGSIAIVPADPDADPAVPKFTATHTLADADDGVTRHYRVKAVNAASTDGGEYSTAVSGTTHDVPDAPTGLAVGDVTVNSGTDTQNDIALSWNSVPDANNGGLAITGYNVEFLTDAAGADWADATAGTPVAHAAGTIETTHAGLDEQDPALTYYYRVRAVSAAGNGDWSSVTTGVKLAPPGAPTELTVTAVDQQEAIDLFWKAPENTGEPPVTSYRIERAVDYDGTQDPPTATWTVLQANYPGTGRAFRDRNLTNPADGTAYADGTTFTYQVTAINVVGAGDPSNADGAISSNKALAPRNLTATVADDMESIVLSWDGPVADEDNPANGGSPITGYKIEVSTDAGATWADVEEDKPEHPENELLTNVPGSEFTYTHMDVAAGTSYIYRVSAVNDAGPGHVSASSTSVSIDAGVPDAPTGLSAMAAADADGITLEWSAPAEIGGSDITSWKIEVSEDYDASDADAATWAELALTVTDPDDTAVPPTTTYSTVHTGLTPGATYTYRVSATNSAGTGDASDIASAVAPDIPGAPTGLTATADGENTINLSWTAPVVPTGASAITGYKIESSDDGTEDSWTDLVANTGNTDVEYADTGLDPATTRHYRVSAMNAAGSTGSASDPANATTADRGIVTRYAVSEDGATSGTCTDAANPCTLEAALSASGASDNDLILVRIRRAGETATIGDDTSIGKMVTLGVYVRGASAAAKGAVSFTGSVAMTDGGDLMTHKDASVHFDELEVSGMSSIDKLTVGDDLTISKDDEENAMTSVLAVDELTVNSGQTLTLGA
ncbi:MAG: fibronectin type III domain-containing protein, partial [Rhodothermaceae bacterium]|nr:fibronectin type III domain-containing protein [Rhodothermaceae bacterium]